MQTGLSSRAKEFNNHDGDRIVANSAPTDHLAEAPSHDSPELAASAARCGLLSTTGLPIAGSPWEHAYALAAWHGDHRATDPLTIVGDETAKTQCFVLASRRRPSLQIRVMSTDAARFVRPR